MKAKQYKRNKKWAAKKGKTSDTNINRSSSKNILANPETFNDDEDPELELEEQEQVTEEGNEHSNYEDVGEDDTSGWKKKKKSGGFQSMGLGHLLLKGILKRGYQVPTPIQRKTIPLIMEGRDVVAMARTGSGKTAAFLIPLFEKLQLSKARIGESVKYPRALIVTPTRELAAQTLKFFREVGKYMDLKAITILGGDSMESQFAALHDKPDVVIATPGRFMHLCVEMEFKLDGVEYVVFDEADRLFEMGFGEQITEILKRLPHNRQTALFSATLPRILVDFTKAGLHDPTLIRLDVDTKLPERLSLSHVACRSEDKLAVLLYILKNKTDVKDQTLVFVATKHHVEFVHNVLDDANISNCYIYSSLDASARKISLGKFRNGKANVMVVTDIAARGIDIPILDNVINYHFPAKPKLFMHRVGRVARAGRSGQAISIVSPDEIASLLDLHLFLGKPIKFVANTSADEDCSKNDDGSVLLARVPQEVVDEELTFIKNLMDFKTDLDKLKKVAHNGYKQYLKSRPNASAESNKRAKRVEMAKLPLHPLFGTNFKTDPMNDFISQIQGYRPHSTIFEIGPKASSETHKVMQLKRIRDQTVIEKHRLEKVHNSAITVEDPSARPSASHKDEEIFINYLPKDHHTETGLSVGSTFDKEVQDSIMDLTGDDTSLLKSQHNLQRWDRKRKKFVNVVQDKPNHKKIKTESGNWIAASYKSDRYKTWQEKSKIAQQMEADESDDDDMGGSGNHFQRNRFNDASNRRPAFSKKLVKTGKNEAPRFETKNKSGKRFKSEIKRPEQVLKERKVKEAKQKKSGPKSKKKGGSHSDRKVGKGGSFGFKGGKGKGKSGGFKNKKSSFPTKKRRK